jgi:hypothetical protein
MLLFRLEDLKAMGIGPGPGRDGSQNVETRKSENHCMRPGSQIVKLYQ